MLFQVRQIVLYGIINKRTEISKLKKRILAGSDAVKQAIMYVAIETTKAKVVALTKFKEEDKRPFLSVSLSKPIKATEKEPS